MKIKNVEVDYFLNMRTKKVHIKELKSNLLNPLINNIDSNFQKILIEEELLQRELLNFDWICYCHEGLILNYKDYQYKILNKKLPYLHEPFLK